jgi:hypothetical protein
VDTLVRHDDRPEGRLSRKMALILTTVLIAGVAMTDLSLSRFYNLGALYMIPFIIATQYVRRSSGVLALAIALVILNYAGMGVAYLIEDKHEFVQYRLMNRGFVAMAIAGAALLAVFYMRVRDYWLRKQSALAPTDEEVSLLLQVFQMFEDLVAIIVAVVLAGVTFVIDLHTPQPINMPILYLMPLAVVAITRSVWLLWGSVPVLLALAYFGFHYSPMIKLADDVERRVLVNREVVAGAIIVAAALFHFLCIPQKRRPVQTSEQPASASA